MWGFLKYYHSFVASGNINWDSVFIVKIKQVGSIRTNTEYNKLLLGILQIAGTSKLSAAPTNTDSLFRRNQVNSDWILKSPIFNRQIRDKLIFIYKNKYQGENTYLKIVYNTADFSGENKYEGCVFPDLEYRLLFLSRFWNIINYFAPYKYLTTNWDSVLVDYIPKIVQSRDSLNYYKTLLQLCKALNDGHSQLTLPNQIILSDLIFGFYTVPFYCEIVNEKVVIRKISSDSIAKVLDIRRGDIILKMDGEDVNQIIRKRRKYISASNHSDEDHQLSAFILDGQTPLAGLTIQRGKDIFNKTVNRVSTSKRDWGSFINYTANETGFKKIGDSILYIYAWQIWNGNLDTIKHLIKQSNAVIFDVRNYPHNDAFFLIADPFLTESKLINYSTVARTDLPGFFRWVPNAKIGRTSDSAFKGKVVILADERTQSQGEYSCMVLQTIPHAITIGSQTAGTDGVRTEIPMGRDMSMSYSGYGIYYPDKQQTQRIGIKIDIPVNKTIEAIVNNKDEILERALKYLASSNSAN